MKKEINKIIKHDPINRVFYFLTTVEENEKGKEGNILEYAYYSKETHDISISKDRVKEYLSGAVPDEDIFTKSGIDYSKYESYEEAYDKALEIAYLQCKKQKHLTTLMFDIKGTEEEKDFWKKVRKELKLKVKDSYIIECVAVDNAVTYSSNDYIHVEHRNDLVEAVANA